jgi:uncharacterized phosphatase
MKQLYFVRHGSSVTNEQGLFSGHSQTPLTKTGLKQAQEAAAELKAARIELIISSPLARAKETAEIIASALHYSLTDIMFSDELIERDFGPLERTTYEPNLGDVAGVEPISSLISRAERSLHILELLPCDNILIVSHGAMGRALRHCLHPEIPFNPSPGFGNGEVVQLI